MQAFFEHEQFGPFGFHHARDGMPVPSADDLGDFVGADFAAEQASSRFVGLFRRRFVGDFGFEAFGQLLALRIKFVQFLIVGLADRRANGLFFLDRVAQVCEFDFQLRQFFTQLLCIAHAAFSASHCSRRLANLRRRSCISF